MNTQSEPIIYRSYLSLGITANDYVRINLRARELGLGGSDAGSHVCAAITRVYNRTAEKRGRKDAVVTGAMKSLMCCYSVFKNKRAYYDHA